MNTKSVISKTGYVCLTFLLVSCSLVNDLKVDEPIHVVLYADMLVFQGDPFEEDSFIDWTQVPAFYDFDKRIAVNDESADIYLSVGCGSDCFNSVEMVNGAAAVWMDTEVPSYTDCAQAIERGYQNLGPILTIGHYSCVLTNSGKIVSFRPLENRPRNVNSMFVFEFVDLSVK